MGGLISRQKHEKKHRRRRRRKSSSSSSSDHDSYSSHRGKVSQKIKQYEKNDKGGSKGYKPKKVTINLTVESPKTNKKSQISTKVSDMPSSKIDTKKYERECIDAHNKYRRAHGVSPLKHSSACTKEAQAWADKLASSDKMQHSSGKDMGENLASYTYSPSGARACKMWYGEIKDYEFRRPRFAGNTGHFTQVVWKNTTHVGVGVARNEKSGKVYTVANYTPAGNVVDSRSPGKFFEENVCRCTSGKSRASSSSSSSSSSSDDDDRGRRSHHKDEGKKDKAGTTVETKTETYTENGRRMKKTITTTTTVKIDGGRKSTSTSTSTKIEEVNNDKDVKKTKDGIKNISLDDKKSSSSTLKNELKKKEQEQFRKECFDRHNELRAKHSVPRLERDSNLDKTAQKWAEHLLKNKKLEHSKNDKLGENVGYKMQYPARYFSGSEITDMWYAEIKDYNFRKPVFQSNTGHFTQVVWKDSKKIGIGVATNGEYTYAVANYDPPGNYQGRFEENVKKNK